MNPTLLSFLKIAAPSTRAREQLDLHFTLDDKKKWQRFRQNLRGKGFLEAVHGDERSDEKLKKFSQMVHMHKTGRGPSFDVKSDSSGKTYTVKYHPDLERFSCSCPDWTIKHTIDGGDCKHIRKLKSQSSMVKTSGLALRELFGAGRAGLQMYRTEGHHEKAWHAGEVSKIHKNVAQERALKRRG